MPEFIESERLPTLAHITHQEEEGKDHENEAEVRAQLDQLPTRLALTASYIADGARTIDKANRACVDDEDRSGYEGWIDDIEPGEKIVHPLVPLVPLL